MLPLRLGSAETEIQSRNELPLWWEDFPRPGEDVA